MLIKNKMEINSSQEILFSSQNSTIDENNDYYQLSTQEIINNRTQEAVNASVFLESLEIKSSQESNEEIVNKEIKNSSQLSINY